MSGFDDDDDDVDQEEDYSDKEFLALEENDEENLANDSPIPTMLDLEKRKNQCQIKRYVDYFRQLREDRDSGVLCDAIIKVEGIEFPVHRHVLKAQSGYFQAMFKGAFSEGTKKVIEIKELRAVIFELVLDYLYGDPLLLTPDNVQEVAFTADMLCMDSLIDEVKFYIESDVRYYSRLDLKLACTLTSRLNLGSQIMDLILSLFCDYLTGRKEPEGVELLNLPFDFLKTVISHYKVKYIRSVRGSSLVIFLLRWFATSPNERLENVRELLSILRLLSLTVLQTKAVLEMIPSMITSDSSQKLSLDIFNEILKKEREEIRNLNLRLVQVNKNRNLTLSIFNFQTWEWDLKCIDIQIPDGKFTKFVLCKNRLFIFDPDSCFSYNLDQAELTALPPYPVLWSNYATFCVMNNSVYMIGDDPLDLGSAQPEDTNIYELDLDTKTWNRKCIWENPRYLPGVVASDKDIFIAGGYQKKKQSKFLPVEIRSVFDAFKYCPETDSLKKIGNSQHIPFEFEEQNAGNLYVYHNKLIFIPDSGPSERELVRCLDLETQSMENLATPGLSGMPCVDCGHSSNGNLYLQVSCWRDSNILLKYVCSFTIMKGEIGCLTSLFEIPGAYRMATHVERFILIGSM